MPLNERLARLRTWWQELPSRKRLYFAALAVVLIAGLAAAGNLLFSPRYAPLFTQLDPKEAGRIVEQLKVMKVNYRLTDQGRTIEVPEKQVYEVRIKLASSGTLANSGVGFELFDQKKFGVTEFEQQVGYQRALQEELRRTIIQLEAVEQARVHLVLPRKSLFIENEVLPSASIALKLKPGKALRPEQVKGIVDLVTGSVEGLKPENVHIIDMDGNVLTDSLHLADENQKATRLAEDQFQLKRNFEKELEVRLKQLLQQVVGPGKAVVMVTADLDFDRQQTTSNRFEGPGQVVSEHNLNEESSGTGGSGGVPGTDSELPGSALKSTTGSSSAYSKQELTKNYQLSNVQESIVRAPGRVKRLSVAVVLNGSYSQTEMQQMRDIVAAAIGYTSNEQRRDQITISSLNFDDSWQKEMVREFTRQEEQARMQQLWQRYLPFLVAGGVIIVLGLLLVVSLRRRRVVRPEIAGVPGLTVGELEQMVEEQPKEKRLEDEVRDLARERPGEVAEIIKLWLKES